MFTVFAFGTFLGISVLTTVVYLPVLKQSGVTEKVFQRSIEMGAISSGSLVLSSLAIDFVLTSSFTKFLSLPGVIASTLITGHFLSKNLVIKVGSAYAIALGVLILTAVIMYGIFVVFGSPK